MTHYASKGNRRSECMKGGDWGEGESAKYCHLSWSWYWSGEGRSRGKREKGIPKTYWFSLILSLVFYWVLFILWLHSARFCSWDAGKGGAELSSDPPLDLADYSLEVSLERPQTFPPSSPFPTSPRWAAPSNSHHQAELPRDYEAPLCKCGERQPIWAQSHWLPDWPPQPGRILALLTWEVTRHYCYF